MAGRLTRFSKVADVIADVERKYGKTQAERLIQAGDEGVNLGLWNPKSLSNLMGSTPNYGGSKIQNAGLLMAMPPGEFESFARPIMQPNEIPYGRTNFNFPLPPGHTERTLDAYLSGLRLNAEKRGLSEPGQLWLREPDPNIPDDKAWVEGHEARHRMRMLARMNEGKALVNIQPSRLSDQVGEPDEVIERLMRTYFPQGTGTEFTPEPTGFPGGYRPPLSFSEKTFAEGGALQHFEGKGSQIVRKGFAALADIDKTKLKKMPEPNPFVAANPQFPTTPSTWGPTTNATSDLASFLRPVPTPNIQSPGAMSLEDRLKFVEQNHGKKGALRLRDAADLGADISLFDKHALNESLGWDRYKNVPLDVPNLLTVIDPWEFKNLAPRIPLATLNSPDYSNAAHFSMFDRERGNIQDVLRKYAAVGREGKWDEVPLLRFGNTGEHAFLQGLGGPPTIGKYPMVVGHDGRHRMMTQAEMMQYDKALLSVQPSDQARNRFGYQNTAADPEGGVNAFRKLLNSQAGKVIPESAAYDPLVTRGLTEDTLPQFTGPWLAEGGTVQHFEGLGSGIVKGALNKIRTYTGSPYKFDKFDPAFIGKGEGSAAFGHGFYSAENPAVAEEYRRITAGKGDSPGRWAKYGLPVDDLESQRVLESLAGMHLPYDEDPRMLSLLAKSIRERAARGEDESRIAHGLGVRAGGERYSPENIKAIMEGLPPGYGTQKPGWLYHLDLNAKPSEFFDWDAPVDSNTWNRIHPKVRDALDYHVENHGLNPFSADPGAYEGRELFHSLTTPDVHESLPESLMGSDWMRGDTDPKKHTSAYLSEVGFPGVRFLDKFSRQGSGDTRNYVVFPQSSDLIDIVNREKSKGGAVRNYRFGGLGEIGYAPDDTSADLSDIGNAPDNSGADLSDVGALTQVGLKDKAEAALSRRIARLNEQEKQLNAARKPKSAPILLNPVPSIQTVDDPRRLSFPGIYKPPSQLIAEAKAKYDAGDEEAMRRLFGVGRNELDEMQSARDYSNLLLVPPAYRPKNGRGSAISPQVLTGRNMNRITNIAEAALDDPTLRLTRSWYEMQPLWDRMSYLGTDPAYQRMFNARTGLHSAGASPVSETNRGTLANMMAEQGRLGDYVNFGGVSEKGSTKKGVYIPSRYEMENFPPDMLDAPSHAYHTTAHVPGLINLEASGKLWSDRHKVPTYVQATDPIWSDPRSPIADSHISRGVGYGDVRTAKSQDSLFKELTNPEYDDFLPWWQQASRKVDMYPRDLQAMIWNVLGPQTGVRTIGSPKLELLSGQIMKAAQRLGVSPETARDLIITGKAGAYDEGGMVPEFGGPEGFVKKGVLSTLNRLAEGKPKTVKLPGVGEMPSYPIKEIEDIAGGFARKQGRDYPVESFPAFDEDRARKVAEAYESMQHNPFDPATKRSYEALIDETMDQYRALRPLGTQFEFLKPGEGNPYKESPALGYHDVLANNRLKVFPTEGGFGSVNETLNHPLEMTKAGQIGDLPDARVNDAFRIVHDMYGHFGPGNPYFRHKGEDRAWRAHARLYSDDAIPAMTSELRGQNSWANFGPYAERNRGASQDDTVYADQKVGLLPSFAWDDYNKAEGGPVQHFQDGGPPDSDYPAIGTTDYNFSNPRDDFGEFRLTPTAAERRASMERLQNAGTRTDPVRSYLGNLGKRISDYRANQAELWSGKEYNPNDQANSQLGMMNRILLENMSGGLSHNIAARYGTNPDQLDYAAEVGRQKAMTQGARDNIHPGLRDLADVLPFATTLPFQMGTQPLMSMASSFLNPAPSYMAKIKHAADEQTVPIKKGISGMYNLLRDNFPRRLPEFDDGGVVGSGALSARLGGDPMAFVKGIIPGAVDQFGDVPGQKQVQPPPTLPPLPAPQGAGQAGQGSSGSSAFNMGLSALPMIAKMFGGAGGAGGAGAAVPEIPPIYAAGGSVDDDMLGYHVMNYAMGGYVPGFDDGGPVQPPGSMGSVMNTPQWGQNGPPGSMGSVMNTPQWGQNGPDGQPRQLIDSPIDWLTGRPADWSMAPQSAQVPPSMPGNTGQPQNVLNNMANSVMPMPPPTPQGLGQGVGALSGGMNGTGGGAGGNNPIRGSLSIQGSF